MATAANTLRDRREAVVRTHMESENRHEFDVTLGTFAHPRYELIATGEVYDGVEEVMRYYAASRAAFPDQRNEVRAVRHADDAGRRRVRLVGYAHRRVAWRAADRARFPLPDARAVSCSKGIASSANASTSTQRPSSVSSDCSPELPT